MKKYQKDNDNINYYIKPNLSLILYKPKVMIINSKYIVLEFDKAKSIGLLSLLNFINFGFKKRINEISVGEKTFYGLYSDLNDTFTIRCSLPNKNGRYHIKYTDNDEEIQFRLPNKNIILDKVIIDIRNMWERDEKIAFNLELKEINMYYY